MKREEERRREKKREEGRRTEMNRTVLDVDDERAASNVLAVEEDHETHRTLIPRDKAEDKGTVIVTKHVINGAIRDLRTGRSTETNDVGIRPRRIVPTIIHRDMDDAFSPDRRFPQIRSHCLCVMRLRLVWKDLNDEWRVVDVLTAYHD